MTSADNSGSLLDRLGTELGLAPGAALDPDFLPGLFNRFRPHGAGVERLFGKDPVQQAVLARIMAAYAASAASWQPSDIYFVMRRCEPLGSENAGALADAHLAAMQHLARCVGDSRTERALSMQRNDPKRAGGEALAILVYECLGDFLAQFQPGQDELFLLKEALYSMAADQYLMAYMLWPAIGKATGLPPLLDPYFSLWRHGLRLRDDGVSTVALHSSGRRR